MDTQSTEMTIVIIFAIIAVIFTAHRLMEHLAEQKITK